MKTYSAVAMKWREWWQIDIDGVGVTQSRTLARAEQEAQDYIATLYDIDDPSSIHVAISVQVTGVDAVEEARELQQKAHLLAKDAAKQSRQAIVELKNNGLSLSDIAYLLGVTKSRAAQLVKSM